MAKYYIGLTNYQQAAFYIQIGLDISRMLFCSNRLIQFFLQHIHLNIISGNLSEIAEKLQITEMLIKDNCIKFSNIINYENTINLKMIKIKYLIKINNETDIIEQIDIFNASYNSILNEKSESIELLSEGFIETYATILDFITQQPASNKILNEENYAFRI